MQTVNVGVEPVQIQGGTIINNGPSTAYYGGANVSASVNTGSIASGSSVTVTGSVYVVSASKSFLNVGDAVPYTTIFQQPGVLVATNTSATRAFTAAGTAYASGATVAGPCIIPIYGADLQDRKLRVRMLLASNDADPASAFTAGLSAVSASAGGSAVLNVTFGAAVSGTTAALADAAIDVTSGVLKAESQDFAVPADGGYVLTVLNSATLAAASAVGMTLQLQARRT